MGISLFHFQCKLVWTGWSWHLLGGSQWQHPGKARQRSQIQRPHWIFWQFEVKTKQLLTGNRFQVRIFLFLHTGMFDLHCIGLYCFVDPQLKVADHNVKCDLWKLLVCMSLPLQDNFFRTARKNKRSVYVFVIGYLLLWIPCVPVQSSTIYYGISKNALFLRN